MLARRMLLAGVVIIDAASILADQTASNGGPRFRTWIALPFILGKYSAVLIKSTVAAGSNSNVMSYIRWKGVFAYVYYSRERRFRLCLIFEGKAFLLMYYIRWKGVLAYVVYSGERPFCLLSHIRGTCVFAYLLYPTKRFFSYVLY